MKLISEYHLVPFYRNAIHNVKLIPLCTNSSDANFPKFSSTPSGGEKSNQVSIAGHVEGVEAARKAIRRLLPLVLAFDFQIGVASRGIVVPSIDANHPLIQRVQQVLDPWKHCISYSLETPKSVRVIDFVIGCL